MTLQRYFTRQASLDAFRCDVPQLEAFCALVQASFGREEREARPATSLSLSERTQRIAVPDLSDLTGATSLPSQFTSFELTIVDQYQDPLQRYFSVSVGAYGAVCTASANDPGWCAGAIDLARGFARQHRVWYWWLKRRSIHFLFLLSLAAVGFALAARFVDRARGAGPPTVTRLDIGSVIGFLAATVVVVSVVIRQRDLLPAGTLVLARTESWIRRYATEINIAAAVVAAIAAAVAIFR